MEMATFLNTFHYPIQQTCLTTPMSEFARLPWHLIPCVRITESRPCD
jgi:hypothetical protein